MFRRDEILNQIELVLELPAVASELFGLVNDPDADIKEVVKILEHDPGLTANLLKLANSAHYGGRGSIASLRDAVVRLGMGKVAELALAIAFSSNARRFVQGYHLAAGQLWEHSLSVSAGTTHLAKALNVPPPGFASTAGLLHDIGKVVLGTFVEVDAQSILECVSGEEIPFDEAERRVLGIDHAEVGAVLLESWGLPADIVEAVRYHHRPDDFEGDPLGVDLVHIADILSMESGIGAGEMDGLCYRVSPGAGSRRRLRALEKESVLYNMVCTLDELLAAMVPSPSNG
jgi:putative nucleotidyltransferase with HDIG domain